MVVVLLAVGLGWVVYAHRTKPLLVVGDSLAFFSSPDLRALGEGAGYDTTVDAIPGANLSDRLPAIEQQAGRRSGPLVIELGTNDVWRGAPADEVDGSIDRAVGYLVDVPCAVFVDVGLLTSEADVAAAVNLHVLQSASQHRNMHVYDWAGEFGQHPDWTADGVHLLPDFVHRYAQGVINAVKSDC